MKIVYYTSSIAGTGRIIQGVSICMGLRRMGINCEFLILSNASPDVASIADRLSVSHIEIPPEDSDQLNSRNYGASVLYLTLRELQPDILIVDRLWFSLHHFINRINCLKIFFTIQVSDNFFYIKLPCGSDISFCPEQYSRVFTIEPFNPPFHAEKLAPMIIRNRDEILSRDSALEKLGLNKNGRKYCLTAINYKPGHLELLEEKYSYLENEGYTLVRSTNLGGGGIFPAVDYFNAFDLVICAAGYTQYWETKYFNKKALYETLPLKFSSMDWRIRHCQDCSFQDNGCDQLAEIIGDYQRGGG